MLTRLSLPGFRTNVEDFVEGKGKTNPKVQVVRHTFSGRGRLVDSGNVTHSGDDLFRMITSVY